MDTEEENMSWGEMMEKVSQLEHSRTLLRDQNTQMRSWLDLADEEMVLLRAENNHLKKQVKDLEKVMSDAQSVESEPNKCQPECLVLKKRNEMKIQELEKESVCLKEENKKLTTEIRTLQQLQEQDNVILSKLKVSLQTFESEMEIAQLQLQQRDEVIHQKHQELKHAEELVEEYSTIIMELRLKKQELKEELEDGQDELTLAIAVDHLEANDKRSSPALSFAEELMLLDSSVLANTNFSEVSWTNGEVISEKVQKTNCLVKYSYSKSINEKEPSDTNAPTPCTEELKLQAIPIVESPKHSKCVGLLMSITQKVLQLLGTFFLFLALALITSGSVPVISEPFSLNTFWSSAWFLLEPHCTLQYGGMPPI